MKFVYDRLSVPFVILSFLLCGTIGAFATRYLHREPGYNRFFTLYAVFLLGMVLAALAGTIETLFAGWELVGLSSALLVAFFQERPAPPRNGLRVWVVYRVSDDAQVSGVQVGPHFFPGYPVEGEKNVRFALFALQYDQPADTPMKVVARDAAGNEATAEFWHKVFPKKFRSRDIPLEDSFVQKVVPEIMAHTREIQDQGDPVKTFVEINSKLRRLNHETIARLANQSPGRFLWSGPFLQLSNSKVESFFADRRTYVYNGKPVDQQDHVGFDLSVVQHNPIEAANDGKVVLADYFGIYGNTVLIDHGAGLISLYGHMSSIDVKPGQMVKKKEIVGKSGATGLAAGDHLHFGLFLHGVPVNPTEWWDEKWIKDHVLDRLTSKAVQNIAPGASEASRVATQFSATR